MTASLDGKDGRKKLNWSNYYGKQIIQTFTEPTLSAFESAGLANTLLSQVPIHFGEVVIDLRQTHLICLCLIVKEEPTSQCKLLNIYVKCTNIAGMKETLETFSCFHLNQLRT